jgi:GTPase SAR1 family protein
MFGQDKDLQQRLRKLEAHLRNENSLLVDAVRKFRKLDRIAWRMGVLAPDQSYAMLIPWWPLVSVLGTFSAGKSTFINQYLGQGVQETGNQAVDDKFTVICYSGEPEVRVLPGVALDADPRFPFYQISDELDKVKAGEGRRVDAYLQLKTCNSERLRGRILIDSPGFDADSQRTEILRITDHIIDLSDLVLVFFDARHPEPGAMQDTLKHLVGDTIHRHDSSKFLYILNQIDSAVREDNPEDVAGAWQRALAQEGLTAGRFYMIYSTEVASPIEDPVLRERYEKKCNADLQAIYSRIEEVGVERTYRIINTLEKTAHDLEAGYLPRLQDLLSRWLRGTLWRDLFLWLLIVAGFIAVAVSGGYRPGQESGLPVLDWVLASPRHWVPGGLGILVAILVVHGIARHRAARSVLRQLRRSPLNEADKTNLGRAFLKNTRWWHSVFRPRPVGWSGRVRRRLHAIIAAADEQIQAMNDRFSRPSGKAGDGHVTPAGTATTATPKTAAEASTTGEPVENSPAEPRAASPGEALQQQPVSTQER